MARGIGGGPASAGTPVAKRAQVAARRTRAFKLRWEEGWTWQAIADELGYCSKGAAHQDVQRAIAALNARSEAAHARAREQRAAYGPIIREAWAELLERIVEVDPVQMVWEAERPLQVVGDIGRMRAHVDAWWAPLDVADGADPMDDAASG